MAPGGVELCLRRSLEVRESPELQNGGLRPLGEALDDFLIGISRIFPGGNLVDDLPPVSSPTIGE